MCRNIRTLYNFEPSATHEEIRAAALQFVRKVSGFARPSTVNEKAFDQAVDEITRTTDTLLKSLKTTAYPKDRENERAKARVRAVRRFGEQK